MNSLKFVVTRFVLTKQNTWRTIILRSRSADHAKDFANKNESSTSTVDPTELKLFSTFKNKWWGASGEMNPLHAMNPLRIQFIRDGLMNAGFIETNPALPLEGIKLVDVGCGGGYLSEPLARMGANVIGIDACPESIDVAKDHAALDSTLSEKLNYVCTTIEDLAQTDAEKYDAVVASEVIEHVDHQKLFLESCVRLLKPKGSIFITTFNKTYLSWLGGIIAAEYVLKYVPMGTHHWDKFISPSDVQRILETHGCKTTLIHGMFYNPIVKKWFWCQSLAVNYALHAVKQE